MYIWGAAAALTLSAGAFLFYLKKKNKEQLDEEKFFRQIDSLGPPTSDPLSLRLSFDYFRPLNAIIENRVKDTVPKEFIQRRREYLRLNKNAEYREAVFEYYE